MEFCRELSALPERVLRFTKKMAMDWKKLVPSLRRDVAVDNVMRVDLRHFCRYALTADSSGEDLSKEIICRTEGRYAYTRKFLI